MAVPAGADAELAAKLERLAAEQQPAPGPAVIERCGYCDFEVAAPISEARAAWAEHTCSRPEAAPSPRRPSGLHRIR